LHQDHENLSDKVLWSIVGLLVAALTITAAVKLSPRFNPPQKISLPLDPACDLHQGSCAASLPGGGRMEFSLEPRPIPVLKPLRLEVRVAGFKADSMEVDFAGADMKMAFNRPRLEPEKGGLFSGQTSLPVCVRDKMNWQATVLVESDGKQIAVPFRFETKRN
jgi:hypothetical protein